MTTFEVVAEGLGKRYGPTRALDSFDLAVPTGTVYGLLGPNGAGKTTAVRVLATLLRFDAGRASVAGYDVLRQPDEVRARIGLTGQYAAVDETLSGRQNLELFGRLFRLGRRAARQRADELLERFGLEDAAGRSAVEYSGGMRRRLDLAASLIRTPRVLFLDEPTTGLDPRSRNQVWDLVRDLVADGTTVLLTTQYLEEADQLAHRISVIDAGRVVAEGSPDELKAMTGGDRVEVVVRDVAALTRAARIVASICGAEPAVDPEVRRLSVPVADRVAGLVDVVRALDDAGIAVEDIGLRRATLDEAFLHLTGHRSDEAREPVGVGRKADLA
jgi:ABC-2 type transport system ATP-binding protein